MELLLKDDLPFLQVTIVYRDASLLVDDVLLDTGSASTLFSADIVTGLGIVPEANDVLQTIQGVGGVEVVYERQIEALTIGDQTLHDLSIEIGGMDYGFAMNGILGMDVLKRIKAVINLATMRLEFEE